MCTIFLKKLKNYTKLTTNISKKDKKKVSFGLFSQLKKSLWQIVVVVTP